MWLPREWIYTMAEPGETLFTVRVWRKLALKWNLMSREFIRKCPEDQAWWKVGNGSRIRQVEKLSCEARPAASASPMRGSGAPTAITLTHGEPSWPGSCLTQSP